MFLSVAAGRSILTADAKGQTQRHGHSGRRGFGERAAQAGSVTHGQPKQAQAVGHSSGSVAAWARHAACAPCKARLSLSLWACMQLDARAASEPASVQGTASSAVWRDFGGHKLSRAANLALGGKA